MNLHFFTIVIFFLFSLMLYFVCFYRINSLNISLVFIILPHSAKNLSFLFFISFLYNLFTMGGHFYKQALCTHCWYNRNRFDITVPVDFICKSLLVTC